MTRTIQIESLHDQNEEASLGGTAQAQRLLMVWQWTLSAYAFGRKILHSHGLCSQLPAHDELACEFLLVFSRFEFALKQIGYVEQNGDRLIVKWRRFARETPPCTEDQASSFIRQAVELLATRPPARQVLTDGKLDWEPEKPRANDEITSEWLLEMVYRVRNNLFHGGKWPRALARDQKLLSASLTLINECLRLSPDLYKAFSSRP